MQPSLFDEKHDNIEESQEFTTQDIEIEQEIKQLLEHVSSATVNTLRDKVAWILNHFPETRNSDITLQIKFWETFESDKYKSQTINTDDLYKLTRLTSLARERARIQNIYKLFIASTDIRRQRGTLSEEEKEKAVEDKPKGVPALIVFMDESGKNDDKLIVGSMWFMSGGFPFLALNKRILKYKEDMGFKKEFHFSELNRSELPIYTGMIDLFLTEASTVSFKIVSVPTKGISNKQSALQEMYYQLLLHGVSNENETGRATLPRILQVWKDAEEQGADRLLIANIDDRLKQAAKSRFTGKLFIDEIHCVDSSHSVFMQIADLFTASANRILNRPGQFRNHKDEFAEYFLKATDVSKPFSQDEQIGDMVFHYSL